MPFSMAFPHRACQGLLRRSMGEMMGYWTRFAARSTDITVRGAITSQPSRLPGLGGNRSQGHFSLGQKDCVSNTRQNRSRWRLRWRVRVGLSKPQVRTT